MKRIWGYFILLALICSNSYANMRAPMGYLNHGMEEIRTDQTGLLTVIKEDLHFEAGYPFLSSVKKANEQKVRVNAKYIIFSEKESNYTFEFVSGKASDIEILVNKDKTDVKQLASKIESEYEMGIYQLEFTSKINKGFNTIEASYVQKMSYIEYGYGYFFDGEFSTYLDYYLYPLKEWRLGPNFTLNISASFKDDTGFSKHIFGSDYDINMYVEDRSDYLKLMQGERHYMVRPENKTPVEIDKSTPNNILKVFKQFKSDFPDVIRIECKD